MKLINRLYKGYIVLGLISFFPLCAYSNSDKIPLNFKNKTQMNFEAFLIPQTCYGDIGLTH